MQSNLRYAMYLRKSLDSEDRQKASIPAQRKEVLALASRRGLNVVREFEESRSAKKPGRPAFSEMMEALDSGEVDAIVCWHLNRLARNSLDGGLIIWSIGEGKIREIVTPHDTYTNKGDDKLMMQIKFGMAEKFVDDLSADVKRGNEQALQRGDWPNKPPIGYVRNPRTRGLEPDPDRFEEVRSIWRARLSGDTVLDILDRSRRADLRNPTYGKIGGGHLGVPQIYRLLRNPFYAGVMRYNGKTYPGRHAPMVTWSEYEAVQTSLEDAATSTPRPKSDHPFAYRGLITCGRCGALVTAEKKTNRFGSKYVYYHCCRKRRRYIYCPEGSIEERKLDEYVREFLESLVVPEAVGREAILLLREHEEGVQSTAERQKAHLKGELCRIDKRLSKLLELVSTDVITPDAYAQERERLASDQRRIAQRLAQSPSNGGLLEPFEEAISFVNQATLRFAAGDHEEKREIVQAVVSNLTLKDQKPLIQAKTIFDYLRRNKSVSSLCAEWNDVRTHFSR